MNTEMPYYKIFNEEECHQGLQYHDGLNEDIVGFNPKGSCKAGGMYYSGKDILAFIFYGPWIREVVLLEDSKIYKDPEKDLEKWKTDKFFLKPRKRIDAGVIQKLIDEGAWVNAGQGRVLRWACSNNNVEILEMLLKNGADVHILNENPLINSCSCGHLKVVKFLLKNGADVHAIDDAPLRLSSIRGYLEVVKFLLKNGADVHALDDESLRYASANGHLEVVKFLLKNGADVHALDDESLRYASANGHLEVVEILRINM